MRITILVENHKGDNSYEKEHGLSQWIEVDEKRILFDLGASQLYLKNAMKLGIDLQMTDYLVLSHGHFDHGVGLDYFPYKKPLILHPDAFTFRTHNGKVIGILTENEANTKFEVIETKVPYQITDNSYFLGEIPRRFEFENESEYGEMLDDSAIAIKTPKGIVVSSGCAHSGICNTIEYAKEILKDERIYVAMGGFHLGFKQEGVSEKAIKTIQYFKENKIQNAYLGHCTSDDIIVTFKDELKDYCNVESLYVGKILNDYK